MARGEHKGKTLFAVSHGQFLHNLIVYLISGQADKQLLESGSMNPHNNALTIIDFDVEDRPHTKGETMVNVVIPRLVAHNLQIIPSSAESKIDFEP